MLTLENIKELFLKYKDELIPLKEEINSIRLKNNIRIGVEDIEMELTYFLLREKKPEKIIEISPNQGWSTLWILSALNHNDSGKLYSYDLLYDAYERIPKTIRKRWSFTQCDVKEQNFVGPIDYLFLDSEHTAKFFNWYYHNLFSLMNLNSIISIHDIFYGDVHPLNETNPNSLERRLVFEWLIHNDVEYLELDKNKVEVLQDLKKELGIKDIKQEAKIGAMVYVWKNLAK